MHWTGIPRYIADFVAYRLLMVPDKWRPFISTALTVAIWVDLNLAVMAALFVMAFYAP